MGIEIKNFGSVQDLNVNGAVFKGGDVEALYSGMNALYRFRNGNVVKYEEKVTWEELSDILFEEDIYSKDAFLMATEGFEKYVQQEELLIDYVKSASAKEWLSYLLTRIGLRLNEGDESYSALGIFIEE